MKPIPTADYTFLVGRLFLTVFRMIPTRATCGATSLSSSSHLAVRPYLNWVSPAMSAMGQKPTYALQQSMSALPPKADMRADMVHVRFVPIADIDSYSNTASGLPAIMGGRRSSSTDQPPASSG
jgi:hypothetical protein